jgi:hypothetical protein
MLAQKYFYSKNLIKLSSYFRGILLAINRLQLKPLVKGKAIPKERPMQRIPNAKLEVALAVEVAR